MLWNWIFCIGNLRELLLNIVIFNFLFLLIINCIFKLFWDKDNIVWCIYIVCIYYFLLGIKFNINI